MTNSVTGQQCRELQNRFGEVTRRIVDGTLSFEATMDALQEIVEGRSESAPEKQKKGQVCQAFSGCRCSICGGFFADGDNVCGSGHIIGNSYE